jgi:predicted esterase
MHHFISTLVLFLMTCSRLVAGELIIKDSQGMDCHVYLPEVIDPATTYQLVVGVHGAGGKGNGAAGMKGWANRGDVIVIGPSFETKGERPYQNGDGIHAEKLIALFEELKKTYKLREQMFLHGFSGGSQFVHRFVMLHPKLVCGVSAHSGGTWATDNYGTINPAAKKIPFAISCGEKDDKTAFGGAPYTRIEWFRRFRDEIDQKNFCHIAASWPDVGHSMSAGAWDLAKQCFQLATGLPGESATQPVVISPDWKNLDHLPAAARTAVAKPAAPEPAQVNQAELEQMAQAAFKRADAETIPDDLLVGFMKRYPPVLWKDKPGSANLLVQCKSAAKLWHETAKTKGLWNAALRQEFLRFSQGLELEIPE